SPALGNRLTYVAPDEECIVMEYPLVLRTGVRRFAFGMQVENLDVLQAVCPPDHRLYQHFGRCRYAVNENILPGFKQSQRLVRGREPDCIRHLCMLFTSFRPGVRL